MVFSAFNEKSKVQKNIDSDYVINFYRTKKYDDEHILVTTEHGGWAVLNQEEFDLLRFNKLNEDENLKRVLEDKGIVLTEKSRNDILNATKNKFHHTWRGTSLHILVPTLRCNMKCIYCHAKSHDPKEKKYDMTTETAKKVVDFIFQSPSPDITIEYQGGEPLLNFEIIKYIHEYAKQKSKETGKRTNFVIVTNFTTMTEEKLKYLMDNKIDLCTSIDGPKELHDHNRKFYGSKNSSYDEVIKTIGKLKKYGRGMGALPTITKKSLEYPIEIVDEYILLGLDNFMSRNLNCMGFAKNLWDKLGYTAEEYIDFFKKEADYILEVNKKGYRFIDFKLRVILQRLLSDRPRTFTCFGSPCGAVIGQIAYAENGNIYTCDEARSDDTFIIGNVHTHTYVEVMKKSGCKIVDLSSCMSLTCDNCVWYPYCGTCMVWAKGGQDNPISKLAMDYECKIRKFQVEYLFEKLIFDKEARKILMHWAYPKKHPYKYTKNLKTLKEREEFIKSLK
ncbi:MAG: His-Xaa-Ser system radical SAM maturase HxsB [Nanoarchaeota archaeon]|nr:His-Xaa-Ser system radical SAM maturase HxsB [Nanoarchaeota archaeon]